ncbi:MAG TPA: hypothetical protein VGI10_21965 [Polyangiaceae bacterium]|jgi:uncharacterized protein involved in exopolysaccharide biosynthesis
MNAPHVEPEEEEGSGGLQLDLIGSYFAFGVRAVRDRKLLAAGIFLPIAILSLLAAATWPRTYHCETILMIQSNQVFQESKQDALGGAAQVITRQENLEAIINQLDLVRDWQNSRSGLSRVKDAILDRVRGVPDAKDRVRMVVGTLQYALNVTTGPGTLTLSMDWSTPEGAAKIVAAAQQSFLESRHNAEIASLAEYISILEGHAAKVHDEIDSYAAQIQKIKDDRLAAVESGKKEDVPEKAAIRIARAPVRAAPKAPTEDELQAKELLQSKQRELKELQAQRTRRLTDLQAKKLELETKYTSQHPEVLAIEQNILSLSSPAPDEVALKREVQQLVSEQDAKAAAAAAGAQAAASLRAGGGGGVVADVGTPAAGTEPLSPEVMMLMQDNGENLDPALASQLRFAVDKYAMLRGKIGTARIDLDTAQAAFAHRYQVVVPAEVQRKPIKPKVPLVIGGGLVGALVLALLACVLAELRTGRIVERWQIYQMGLPVLAELPLPRNSLE